MITIPTAEQEAFQSSAPKTLTLNFSSGDPLTNEDIYMESLLLEQSICEESNLTFGMVYSSHFSVRIFDTGVSYTNQRVNPVLSVTVDGTTYTRSLGYYTVKSDRLTSDKLYRDLECYDYLVDVLQTDFTSWHNQMPSTYTLGQYRNAFFQRIGLAQSDFADILDDMGLIRFKVDELSGATVISAILQAYGVFGYLGYDETHNDWRFRYVRPSKIPVLTIDDNSYVQGSLNYEDEPIRLISGVKILGWSEDYGEEGSTTIPDVTFGDDVGSMLTIEDNYLIHSLEENPRQSMCHGIYNNVSNFNYYPTSVETPVWMGIEPGDVIKIETDRKDVYFPVFKRTLKGISALKDEYEAQGEYELTANASAGGVSGTGTSIEQMRESIAELLAQKASIDAQDAAIQANIAANSALTQLSIVEDVAGTLRWISENGEFVETQDTTVQPGTVYFIYENGEYVPITNPDTSKNPHEEGWYILDVTDSQASFIMAHLAVTNAGLWILPVDQMVSHQLVDSNDNDLIDSNNNLLVDYGKDEENIHQASGYKVLISGETTDNHPVGVSIYNSSGDLIANYGETTTIGSALLRHVYIDNNAVYIKNGDTVLAKYGENVELGENGDVHIGTVVNGNLSEFFTYYSDYPDGNQTPKTAVVSHNISAITSIVARCVDTTTLEYTNVDVTSSDYSLTGSRTVVINSPLTNTTLVPWEVTITYSTAQKVTQLSIGTNHSTTNSVNYPFIIGNNNPALSPGDVFRIDWGGRIYSQGHSSPIGAISDSGSQSFGHIYAGIDSYDVWMMIRLTRGTWIVYGEYSCRALDTVQTVSGCMGLRFCKGGLGASYVVGSARQLTNINSKYQATINACTILTVEEDVNVYAVASCHYECIPFYEKFKAVCIA